MNVTLPNGTVIEGVPDNATKDQIRQKAIASGLATEADFGMPAPQEPSMLNKVGGAIADGLNAYGNVALEGAAAVNRGATKLVDFASSLPNAVSELAGSDARIPSLTKALSGATAGNFMEPGLARDVVRQVGETIPAALVAGGALRSAANSIPAFAASGNAAAPLAAQGTGANVLRQMGSSTALQDTAGAALSGAGSVVGGEAGEAIGGDTGKQIGSFVGSIAAPVAGALAAEAPRAIASAVSRGKEASLIREAAPTIDRLKESAREVYKEIDDLGAVVNSGRVAGLIRNLNSSIKSEGFNRRIHPKVSAALREISTNTGKELKVTELDVLRKVARSAAASIEPEEARLGSMMVNKIDDFMDSIEPADLVGGQSGDVGGKYRQARQLWQRARKAEDIESIFERAKNQASGFENGLRTQFRSLLNNKKKIRNYTPQEKAAMQKVVRGGGVENIAKAIGKFGFSEGQATSMLLGSLGVAGGAAIGGGVGAVAVPLVGQVSKNLAQKLTRNNAELVSQIVRSGKNATDITRAYVSSVPSNQRSSLELSELLLAMNATGPIKFSPNNQQVKSLVSDAAILVGAAKSQTSEAEE